MLDIEFDCIIILNGTITAEDISLLKEPNNIIKIAADGAANILLQNDIIPDYIIGDLDSFNLTDKIDNKKIISVTNQEQYDFEKCLEFAMSINLKNILVLGMNGGQLDHTLNNWSIFVKYSLKIKLSCYSNRQIGTLITKDIVLNAEINDIISIIPTPITTLTTQGLMWNLNKTTLELGKTEGARNKAINNEVFIKLHSGKYMLFMNRECK